MSISKSTPTATAEEDNRVAKVTCTVYTVACDDSNGTRAEVLWFPADVFGLFSNNVGPFSINLVPSGPLFSANVVREWAMFLGQAIYVLEALQLWRALMRASPQSSQ